MRPGTGLLIAAALVGAGCLEPAPAVSRTVIRLVRESTLSEPLAREYARSLPHVEVRLVEAVGSVATVDAIQRGEADLGFALADVAYFAYLRPSGQSVDALRPLRGIAALQVTPVHLLTRPGLTVRNVGDLRGLKVGTGTTFSGLTRLADLVLRSHGLGPDSVEARPIDIDVIDALMNGGVDAAFTTGYYPSPPVQAATSRGARLVPIDGPIAEHLRHEYPFLRRVSIPASTYPRQHETIGTIGVDRLFVCRGDLDERLVHDLTEQLLDALPRLSSLLKRSLRLMDLEQASATPIPLHEGAARYYRERQLAR